MVEHSPRPYVAAAVFCERVLEERGGVFSAIRIVDTVTVDVPPDPQVKPAVHLVLFVLLKSGEVRAKRTVKFQLRSPAGKIQPIGKPAETLFKGDEQGIAFRVECILGVERYGLYWAEVFVDDEVLTRVPLRLRASPESDRGELPPRSSEP